MHEPTAASPAAETSLAGETTEGPGSPEPPAARLLAYNEAFTRAGMLVTARAGPSLGSPNELPLGRVTTLTTANHTVRRAPCFAGQPHPAFRVRGPRETCRCIAPLSIDADSAR